MNYKLKTLKDIGVVEPIGDGIVSINVLTNVAIGEFIINFFLKFKTKEKVLNIEKSKIIGEVRSTDEKIKPGQYVKRTFHVNKMYPVAEGAEGEGIVLKLKKVEKKIFDV